MLFLAVALVLGLAGDALTWPDVALAAVNVAQVLGLAYLAWVQSPSARRRAERAERALVERQLRTGPPTGSFALSAPAQPPDGSAAPDKAP
jgi:threonine/homoserine/homoserine lactone efflux protein